MRHLLILAVLLGGCSKSSAPPPAPPPAEVQVARVVQEDVPIYGEWVGTTDGMVNADIKPQVTGYLLSRNYQEGKPVRKGTLLFQIDPRTFEAALSQAQGRLGQAQAQRDQAQSQVVQAQAGVSQAQSVMIQARASMAQAEGQQAQAKAARDQAKAQLAKTQMDQNRLTPLVKENAAPQQQLDDAIHANEVSKAVLDAGLAQIEVAQGRVQSARGEIVAAQSGITTALAAVSTARAAVSQADAQIRTAQADVEAQQLNLNFTRIISPIDGVVGLAHAQVGDLVTPQGEALTTVSTVNPIKVNFTIPETEVMKDKATRQYELILADGRVYPSQGRFYAEDRTVAANTGATRLTLVFPNPRGDLKPGQYARVRAVRRIEKRALLVPQRAVTELQNRSTVTVVGPDHKVEVRSVTLGEKVGSRWTIRSGVKAAELVVTEGLQKAIPGTTVQPVEEKA